MITYFIKSALCLTLLLAFYHLILEREKMHNFNRFYLLGSVLFSFLAPLYVIYEYVAIETQPTLIMDESTNLVINEMVVEESINYTPYLIGIYVLISSILLFRFGKNLWTLYRKIRKNQHIKLHNATLVLVDDLITPHTFWNYIFINKEEYFSEKIETELFTHELAHATQKHSFDVLIVELLRAVFWINPTFYFLKKAVQLNHEFLADSTVVSKHKNTVEYQYLLLNKTHTNDYYLASNLTYLLTKKRLQMMTKQSSKSILLLKKIAVLPLLVGFLFLFAQRVEAQEKANPKVVAEYNKLAKKYNTKSKSNQRILLKDVTRIKELYAKLNDSQKSKAEPFPNFPPPPPSPVIKNGKDVNGGNFVPPPPPPPKKGSKQKIETIYEQPSKSKTIRKPLKKGEKIETIYEQTKEQQTIKQLKSRGGQQSIATIESLPFAELKNEVGEEVQIEQDSTKKSEKGWKLINNQTYYYEKHPNGKVDYYDRWGNAVDENENPKKTVSEKTKNHETGWIKLKGKTIYYITKNNKTSYYDKQGFKVDENGNRLKEQQKDIKPKQQSSRDSIPTKTGYEQVGSNYYAYKVFNGKKYYFDKDSGKQISVKHPEPEDYFEMIDRFKKMKKIYMIDDKRVTKEAFLKLRKSTEKYYYGYCQYKNKNVGYYYASKSKAKLEKLINEKKSKEFVTIDKIDKLSNEQILISNNKNTTLDKTFNFPKNKEPLYYVNGKLTNRKDLNKINTNSVKSIDITRDEKGNAKLMITTI